MISFIFWSLAAICNSIMDMTDHHYSRSVFKNLNPLWWDGNISWKNKYLRENPNLELKKLFPYKKGFLGEINYPTQLTDAWHFFKTLMIIFLTLSVVTFDKNLISSWLGYMIIFIVYYLFWNFWYNLFYNHILHSKK